MTYSVTLSDSETYQVRQLLATDTLYGIWVAWAREHCASFLKVDVTDVSNYAAIYDIIYTFVFSDEADALMFKLRFG